MGYSYDKFVLGFISIIKIPIIKNSVIIIIINLMVDLY